MRRPKVSDDSSTIGLTADELDRLLTAAETHGLRSAALVSLLVYNGLRIAEILAWDVESVTYQRGHRALRIVRKGGKASTEPLSPNRPARPRGLRRRAHHRAAVLNADGTDRLSYSIAYSGSGDDRAPADARASSEASVCREAGWTPASGP